MSTITASYDVLSASRVASLREGQNAPLLLDVRTPAEFGEVSIEGAKLVPLDELKPSELTQQQGNGQSCVVICRSGGRARKAAEKLVAAGMGNVSVLDCGMIAWEAAGLPVKRSGKKVMSLERQVRITTGILVLSGALLGFWVHPGWYGVCAFMGAGLIFSGIADFCGLALILARAPWNRAGA